jgi:hypothetical protein
VFVRLLIVCGGRLVSAVFLFGARGVRAAAHRLRQGLAVFLFGAQGVLAAAPAWVK